MFNNFNFMFLLSSIFIIIAASSILILYRKRNKQPLSDNDAFDTLIEVYSNTIVNLTFNQIFIQNSQEFKNNLIQNLNKVAFGQATQFGILNIQLLSAIKDKNKFLSEFPKHITKMIKDDSASILTTTNGKKILVALDKSNGKFLAHANVSSSMLTNLSKCSALLMNTAHILANHDNAVKLNEMNKKLDLLLELDSNKKFSQLESKFEELKTILIDSHSKSQKINSLLILSKELKELRTQQLVDLKSKLNSIPDPNKTFVPKKVLPFKSLRAKRVGQKIRQLQINVKYIKFTLQLEYIVNGLSGRRNAYAQVSSPEILEKAQEITNLVQERAKWLAEFCPKVATMNTEDLELLSIDAKQKIIGISML